MKKEFDAVEMMRNIRTKLNEENNKDPQSRKKRLANIRNKYDFNNIPVNHN